MEHEGSNNGNANATTETTQRDSSVNNTREFYISQSEPPGSTSSLPTSTSPTPSATTPLVTSPFNEQPSSGSINNTSSNSVLPTVPPTLTNNLTTTTATTTTTTTASTHKTQAAFVNKLYTMVEDQSIQHLISWAPSGDVFSVSNPTEFSKTVLPQYFKHNNWQSFVRQLNMYGFHKVNDMFHANPSSESQAWEFRHQEFRRGHISALQNIRRKNSKHQSPSNPINMKGGLSNAGPGQSLTSDIAAERDERIDGLTNQMAELMDRMRQMTENYSLLYAETVSCRMQQSKHEKVITDIANFLSSILREEDANDPRSLKRKFDVDCIQAEVAKFGQGDAQPSSHLPLTQHPSHYPREGIQPARTISTNPQPMSGVESTSSIHHSSRMTDVEYRSATSPSFSGSQPLHRSPAKIPTSSPLSILPEFPFSSPHMQPSTNYLRHRSPEPITSVGSSGSVSRSSSMDTYKTASISTSNSHSTQSSSQYAHSSPHRATHPPSHMPMSSSQHRRSSQPTSLGFGSDSNLLNPDGNRYKDNSSSPIPQPQRPSSSPSASSSPTYNKTDNPATANPTTSQSRPPPLPEPPDNETEYKRRKRN